MLSIYLKINILYISIQYMLFVIFPYQLNYQGNHYLTIQDRFVDAIWHLLFLKFSYLILFYVVIVFLIPLYLYVFQYVFYKKIYLKNRVTAIYYLIFSLVAVDIIRWSIMNLIMHY